MKKDICAYGCGNKAKFILKCGKACCSKSPNSCPEMRRRNSVTASIAQLGNKNCLGKKLPPAWNKGLSKHTDERVAKQAASVAITMKKHPEKFFTKGDRHTEETKRKISHTMKNNGSGGYNPGSGRGRQGRYKGIWCDSSWELAFVLWCEIKGYSVKRAKKKFPYEFNGKTHMYSPDFRYKGASGVWAYTEVKGWKTEQWRAKKKAFPLPLRLISKKTMVGKILPAVHKVHGRNFTELYE